MEKIIIILLIFFTHKSYSQNNLSLKIPIGLNWRSTTMNLFNFNEVRYYNSIPFVGEWNTQVFSFNAGIQLYSENFRMAIEYVPNFRYGYIHHSDGDTTTHLVSSINTSNKRTNEFIIDHQFRVLKYLNRKPSKEAKLPKYIALGYGINNAGKGVYVKNVLSPYVDWYALDYSTLSVGAGFPIWKGIYFEPSINYIPKTFPNNKSDELLTFSFALRYTINALNF
jgi:hypothetical protein